jgi:transposase InsO family protein
MTSPLPFMRLAGVDARPSPDPSAAATAAGNTPNVWLTLEQAAQRSGLSLGQLRRRCLEGWADTHLARKVANGAKPSWQIAQHADPMFAAVKFPEQIKADLTSLSDQQRQQCLARKAILDAWLDARRGGLQLGIAEAEITERFIARQTHLEGKSISRATLFNWHAAYRRDGLNGLIDQRGSNKEAAGHDGNPFFSCLAQAWLSDRKPSMKIAYEVAIHDLAQRQSGDVSNAPSYKTAQRYLNSLPPQMVIAKRGGPKAYNDKAAPYIQRDYSSLSSNQIWCGDHHRFDVICLLGRDDQGRPVHGRPWLTCWMDVASRRVVGWHITGAEPNTDTILRALRMGLQLHGLPGQVQVDNGKDFDAAALQGRTKRQRRAGVDGDRMRGVFGLLGIDVQHVQPYHGQSKPVERLFRTMADRFSRTYDTYCGSTTGDRPEGLQDRIEGGKAPTLEELAGDFAQWLEGDYHQRPHTGGGMDGQTPLAAYDAKFTQAKRMVGEDMLKFALMPRYGPVKVGRHGVTWNGIHYGGFDTEVTKLYRQRVMLCVDDQDVSKVIILSLDGRLITTAAQNQKLPFAATKAEVREAINEKRRLKRIHTQHNEARPLLARAGDMAHQLHRAAARRSQRERAVATPQTVTPPAIKAHTTGFEDQFEVIAKAVGGSEAPTRPSGFISRPIQADQHQSPTGFLSFTGGSDE